MSFVVACIAKNNLLMLGDTQLNDDNGAVEETGMKVLTLGNNTLVGFTGVYKYFVEMAQDITDDVAQLTFEDKVNFVKNHICVDNAKNNVVIAGIENGITKYVVMGKDYGYNDLIATIDNNIVIKLLLPPDVTESFCRQYIYQMNGIKEQIFNCIKAVAVEAQSVNNKIIGFHMNDNSYELITENINYNDITYRFGGESNPRYN